MLSVLTALALSALSCYGASRHAHAYDINMSLVRSGLSVSLLWHALPGAWWLWMAARARTDRERLAARVVFAIALWTLWMGLWAVQYSAGVMSDGISLMVGPILGAMVLFAFIFTRKDVWRITRHAVGLNDSPVESDDEWATEVLVNGQPRTVRTPVVGMRRRVSADWALLVTVLTVFMSLVLAPRFYHPWAGPRPMTLASCCLPGAWWLWLFIRARSPRERGVAWITFAIAVVMALVGLTWGNYI